MISIAEMASFCKKKGFIYPNSEIYGNISGFFDFGPYGVELKNNIKQNWWKHHVKNREDMIGIDGSIITSPKVWRASGHIENFEDLILETEDGSFQARADQFLEEKLGRNFEGITAEEVNKIIEENNIKAPNGKKFKKCSLFNLMFTTNVGPNSQIKTYLRPETAQLMFTNFKLVMDNARMKLPFGIAQIGRSFRNEISPRNFLFRCREFEQMEIEYFVHPKEENVCPYYENYKNHKILVWSASMQKENREPKEMTLGEAYEEGFIKNSWHVFFMGLEHEWFMKLGCRANKFRVRQHIDSEKSHYSKDTWDLEYEFPFGWKELEGFANRTDYDLKAHMKISGSDLSVYDEETKEKILPYVICEPSLGVERAFLVFMYEAYTDDGRGNITLKFHPKIAPIKVAVYPLVKKLDEKAREVFNLLKNEFEAIYDKSGSVGRRYARADEIGIPYCVTIDFDTVEKDDSVTIRDRDTTEQKRVKVNELKKVLFQLIYEDKKLENI